MPAPAVASLPVQRWAYVYDQKAAGLEGGSFAPGSWLTRTLNTKTDPFGLVRLSSNQMTLLAGTYTIWASAMGYAVGRHQLRLYNVTGGVELLPGTGSYSANAVRAVTRSFVIGVFTVAANQALELQHQCSDATGVGNAMGVPTGFTVETYAQVELCKVA